MARPGRKQVLFVGGDLALRAQVSFDALASRLGLPVAAEARDAGAEFGGDEFDAVVAVGDESLARAVAGRFPGREGLVQHWPVGAGEVESAVADLVAVLLGGKPTAAVPPAPPPAAPRKPAAVVKVGRETAGRKGKGVTTVWELPLDEAGMKELATLLKHKCGTGGTVKDGRIEIQGDHRDRITAELEKLGYKVKRAGG